MAYLFTPLQQWARARRREAGKGVSRKDIARPGAFASLIALPMMVTLFIAGVWHGAGFQFIIYGLLHGFYLTVNHAWRLFSHARSFSPHKSRLLRALTAGSSVLLTFLCVVVSLVFFRATSTGHAIQVLASMVGLHRSSTFMLDGLMAKRIVTLVPCLAIAWFMPNTQQILSRFKPSLQQTAWDSSLVDKPFLWRPNTRWAFAIGILFFIVLTQMEDPSTFLYFQF